MNLPSFAIRRWARYRNRGRARARKDIPQGLLKRLRKTRDRAKSIPRGLKPTMIYMTFMPGINPRPTLKQSFSAACKARYILIYGTTEVVP